MSGTVSVVCTCTMVGIANSPCVPTEVCVTSCRRICGSGRINVPVGSRYGGELRDSWGVDMQGVRGLVRGCYGGIGSSVGILCKSKYWYRSSNTVSRLLGSIVDGVHCHNPDNIDMDCNVSCMEAIL